MKFFARITSTALAFFLAASLQVHGQDTPPPTITHAWVKTTVPGGSVSAAYLSIKSVRPLKLVKAESPVAGLVEIHSMNMKDHVMEMKAVDTVEIPANKLVELKPGGLQVMLMKVGKPINQGDKVPLVLTFEGADKKAVVVKFVATAQEKGAPHQKH